MAAKTWTQTSGNNWSQGLNWNGGTVPATTDTITFDATSTANCTIDALGTWSGGTFTIAATYSGTITQNTGVNITTAAYSQAAGTFTGHSAATFTSTTFAMTAGAFNQGGAFVVTTFTINTGSPVFTGSSATMSTTAVTFANTATIVATSGIWSLAGSFTKANSPTFTHNSGTINITAASTFNAASLTFNKINITTTNAAVTISASTTAPLGAAPTTTVGTSSITVAGTITWSGAWTHTGTLITNNGSTLTGTSTPTLTINQLVTINATTTVTNVIGTITANGATTTNVTDTGNALTGTNWVVNKTGSFNIQASTTVSIGASPTTVATSITVAGTASVSGTWTHTGNLTFAATGVVSGALTTVAITGNNFVATAGATIPSGLHVTHTLTISSGSFAGGGFTFGNVRFIPVSTATITIQDSSTFTDLRCNDGTFVTALVFTAGTTQTVTTFTVAGVAGKLVTLRSGTFGTAFTLHGVGAAVSIDYVVVQDSTADVSPTWTAGSHSADGGGNTNWVFTGGSAPTGGLLCGSGMTGGMRG